ncbi:MAG: TolC family protein [Synergistaceae bacterium]|jgi:outer membrane protein TolC|nr:TolC family protein [Synergistaceae bacterium]
MSAKKTFTLLVGISALLGFSLCATQACAAAATGTPVGILDAIDLTLRNNPELLSLRQEAAKALAFRLQAEGTSQPEVAVGAYVDAQRENQTSDGSSRKDNRVARLSLQQTVYSGGRNAALRRQSRQVTSIADLSLAAAENRAVGELFARFYNVLLQESRIETEKAGIATSELHLREVTRMGELGLSNRLEVIRASLQLATNRANLSSSEGALEAAQISLMNYMGIPPEERRPVTGRLHAIELTGGRAESLAEAMKNRADRSVLENQLEYQANQIEIERSGTRPTVSLGASAGYLDPYRGRDYGDDTWRAELSISVPIFDRNVTRANVMRAEAVIEQDRISLVQKDLDIKSGVETAWAELESTKGHLESTERALELAEESLRLAGVGFQEGVTPQLDLLDAQSSLTASRLEYQRSLYNNMLAVTALKVTEGNIIDWVGELDF